MALYFGAVDGTEYPINRLFFAVYAAGGGKRNMANFARRTADPHAEYQTTDVQLHLPEEAQTSAAVLELARLGPEGLWSCKPVTAWRPSAACVKPMPDWFKTKFWDGKQAKNNPWFAFRLSAGSCVFFSPPFAVHQYYPRASNPNNAVFFATHIVPLLEAAKEIEKSLHTARASAPHAVARFQPTRATLDNAPTAAAANFLPMSPLSLTSSGFDLDLDDCVPSVPVSRIAGGNADGTSRVDVDANATPFADDKVCAGRGPVAQTQLRPAPAPAVFLGETLDLKSLAALMSTVTVPAQTCADRFASDDMVDVGFEDHLVPGVTVVIECRTGPINNPQLRACVSALPPAKRRRMSPIGCAHTDPTVCVCPCCETCGDVMAGGGAPCRTCATLDAVCAHLYWQH